MNRVKNLKIALPKGRMLSETAGLLQKAGWGLKGYTEDSRSYRLESRAFPDLQIKVFHERDIPIQVAVGNYDLGICGSDWLTELLVKYPSSALFRLRNLGYGDGILHAVAYSSEKVSDIKVMEKNRDIVRLVSEYPNLTESFALENRLKRFSIFPLWGAAEVYPPESADLAVVAGKMGEQVFNHNLVPVRNVLEFNACLVVNKSNWERKDLSDVLASIDKQLPEIEEKPQRMTEIQMEQITVSQSIQEVDENTIRLALPDGHQQKHAVELLTGAGISFDDYPSQTGNRRPSCSLEGISIKVIRPQDMPAQVAVGNFDLAVTGKDWLLEHLYQFPSSPVTELLNLKFARVRIVALVSNDLPANDIQGLSEVFSGNSTPIRVASEYVNIADKYARDNHLGRYRVIPTWGATEAFLPEDADLLIENTETGWTIARHNLKVIDTLFVSAGCLVGNLKSISDPVKVKKINSFINTLRVAVK